MATTDTSVAALREFLRSERTKCGSGVPLNRVLDLEKRVGAAFPDDLREYFTVLNGTAGDYAYGIIRFWSIDEFASLEEEIRLSNAGAAIIQTAYDDVASELRDYFVFADHMHEAQLYAIRLRPPKMTNSIILLDGGKPIEVASSLSDFVENYLNSPEVLRLAVD